MEEKPYQNENLKWSGLKQGYVISKYTVYFSLLIVVVKVSSLCPVLQGLASECCRFYNILISTETKQPPPDTSSSVDTSVFIGYPRPDEKKNCKKKKTWAKYLKVSLSFFQDPDRKMRACGGRKTAFSTKVNWLFWETRQHYRLRVGPCFPQR